MAVIKRKFKYSKPIPKVLKFNKDVIKAMVKEVKRK